MRAAIMYFLMFSFLGATAQKKGEYTIQLADSLFQSAAWGAAIPVYESVLKVSAENSLTWNRLGFCYHSLLNYDKAMVNYLTSLDFKPSKTLEALVRSRLARIFSVRNELDKAFQNLDKALLLGYNNLLELDSEQEFSNLRNEKKFTSMRLRAYNNAYPCMGNEKVREFDFWIGEWDTFVTGSNNLAGHSIIERASGGCMILENWSSVGGPFEGKSMNFVDPVTGKWKQIWVGSGGVNVSEFLNGEYRDEAMRFEFETVDAQESKQLVHFYFYNQGSDQVRQLHETSSDGGTTWTTTYDFTYKRKK